MQFTWHNIAHYLKSKNSTFSRGVCASLFVFPFYLYIRDKFHPYTDAKKKRFIKTVRPFER
jgi:hypothetical protein